MLVFIDQYSRGALFRKSPRSDVSMKSRCKTTKSDRPGDVIAGNTVPLREVVLQDVCNRFLPYETRGKSNVLSKCWAALWVPCT